MNAKRFILLFFLPALLVLLLVAGSVFVLDPCLYYHPLWFGLQPINCGVTYLNPGFARHLEYDSIITGSSMSQNFDSGWFDEGFDIHSLMLCTVGATTEDIRIDVEEAETARGGALRYVFSNIDPVMLNAPADAPFAPLPEYMYGHALFVPEYLLNAGHFVNGIKLLRENRAGTVKPLSRFQSWYNADVFAQAGPTDSLSLPIVCAETPQKEPVLTDNGRAAVQKLVTLARSYPDTTFYYFYSPYSIVAWYEYYTDGVLLSDLYLLQYSMEQLLSCDNVRLFFPPTPEIITTLSNYVDTTHFSLDIQYQIFEEMRDGVNRLTEENYRQVIDGFRDYLLHCDYEALINAAA